MALTDAEMALLKKYIRIDYDDDDDLLQQFYTRARISIKNQVGPIDETNADMKEQYDQACALLTQHWNDQRESFRIGNNSYEIPHSLDSITRELKYCYVPISTPTGLEATVSTGVVDLSWNANSEDKLAGYHVYQDSEKISDSLITDTVYQISGLAAGTYKFQVSAVNSLGNESGLSKEINVTI